MENFKTIIKMFRQEAYILTKEEKKKSLLLFLIILIGSFFETLGVTAILPFIESLIDMDSFRSMEIVAFFIERIGGISNVNLIYTTAALIVVVYIIKNLYLLISLRIQYRFRYDFQRNLSVRVLSAILRRPYEYFLSINSMEILRCIDGDVNGVYVVFEFGFKMLSEVLTIAMIAGVLFYIDWVMAAGVIVLSGIVFFGVTFVFRYLLKGIGVKHRHASIGLNQIANQAANGIKEINVMKKNEFFIEQYDKEYANKSECDIKYNFLSGCPEKVIETGCVGAMILIICFRVYTGVELSSFVPQLSVFALAAFRIMPSISRMVGYITGFIFQRPALESAYNNLIEVEKYEKEKNEYVKERAGEIDEKKVGFKNTIKIQNIDWTYPNSDRKVLSDLSLEINKGESVGFVGPSGAGKTTLSDIILGLFRPQRGSVYMDGVDVFTIPFSWSRIIGYVPQTVYLIDDTIRNNIGFGTAPEEIKDEKVWSALEQAQMREFVEGLPEGLDTVVGERGVRFSGGQRQRVAIARALYYDPDILVLDEATSALDNETERAVMEAIESLQRHKTLIIIAHRLSTLRKCDRIFEINGGTANEVEKEIGE